MTHKPDNTERLSKADSARLNGSKSQGATTEQGRANSANANLRHGAYSKRLLLDGENEAFYEHFKTTYFTHFQPLNPLEFQCVESMFTAAWRIRRIEDAETRMLNLALGENKPANEAKFDSLDPLHERALAIESKTRTVESLTRIQEGLHRIYDRNFRLLAAARRKAGRPTPELPLLPEPVTTQDGTGTTVQQAPPEETPSPRTIDPTETKVPSTPAVSIITQILLFLVIFAALLLTPMPSNAKNDPNRSMGPANRPQFTTREFVK